MLQYIYANIKQYSYMDEQDDYANLIQTNVRT